MLENREKLILYLAKTKTILYSVCVNLEKVNTTEYGHVL